MKQRSRPIPAAKAEPEAPGSARPDGAGDGLLSVESVDALAEIAKRFDRLARIRLARLKADDGYQVMDPRTVADTLLETFRSARVDPARLLKQQAGLWTDMAQLWQQT